VNHPPFSAMMAVLTARMVAVGGESSGALDLLFEFFA
jgi:hypothetical protein